MEAAFVLFFWLSQFILANGDLCRETMAAPEQVIQMASLGRPFRLGMVYDCRSDTLIPGITLWDPKELKKNLDVQPQPYFTSQIIATDSTSEKASLLNASASLKGSFLAGLVEVEGSAKFLQDTKKSARQARVTFSYAATTHFQQLTMSQVGKQHITYPEVFGQGLATHVVTGILYGAHAFFVFDQEASSSESLQDIEGNLQVLVKKIPKFSLEGKAEAQMSETEKAAIQKFSCTFYGDFKLKKNPTNYMEAVELYARLPELMGEDGENAVPVKVWLYPLSYLDSTAAKLVREISSKLISDSEKALEHLTEVDMRTNDLARDPICTAFPEIKEKIHHFKGLCQQYRHEFQKDVGRLLPAIRGGGQEEEGALVNHLKKNEASLFNVSRLQAFLDLKCQEIRFVEFFLKLSKGEVSSCDEFMKKVLDPSVDSVFALVFSSLEAKEPYLEELDFGLQEAAGHAPKASPEKGNISTPWFQDKAVLERAQNAATIFADLSLRPQTKEKVQFVVTSSLDESNPGVSIVRYQSGSLEGTRFEILPKPLPPLVDEKTHCSVQLTFKPAEPERSRVSGYHVQYRVSGQENWVSVHVKEDIYPIRGLKAKTSYEFRYAVETSSGCSVASDISQAMLNAFPSSPPPPSPSSSFWGKNVGKLCALAQP
ncbi:neoverrucotoxin subunit beta-like [Sceloporus undulatus]|uniref:neoverrucotoxin subunit beta-like n=1 Tax=Sceloporus undulatus TaxID=8520 RepID=UPI001C4A7F64|nr:neoverrucotoxin subunit beta-like [Sceloporus undulatus]